MFKKSILALSLIALSGTALSSPIANLKIDGTIKPPTCMVNGMNDGDVIYEFNVTSGLFPATGDLTLSEQTKNIEVACNATTYLRLNVTDNRAGTELTTGTKNFGLGTYNTDTKVGFYTITMKNATVKADMGAVAKPAGIRVNVTAPEAAASYILDKTNTYIWAISPGYYGNAQGQIFAADFTVKPTLNALLKNSDGTAALDGHAILTFSFSI